MNTVEKGDKFELLCKDIISKALSKGELSIIPEHCKIFSKNGYYSRDRGKDIIFDLSIEVKSPGASKNTFLYLIECKDYSSKPVPVDDLEEFSAKVNQISGVQTKGVFITSNTFQSGAYNFANSKGIILIEVNENLTYNIVLHKTLSYSEKLIESEYNNTYFNNLPEDINRQIQNKKITRIIDKSILKGFVNYLKLNSNTEKKQISRYSKGHIEEITGQLLNIFDSGYSKNKRIPNLITIAKQLGEVFDLTILDENIKQSDSYGRKIISTCSFVNKTITIDKSVKNTGRYNFLLAHELGHFFLHNKVQIKQEAYESLSDSEKSLKLNRYLLENERNWLEWQANQFAASFLMPKEVITYFFAKEQDKIGLRPGTRLYVDEQPWNQHSFKIITGNLSVLFQTSKTSVIYRLNSLNLLKEQYQTKHISQVMDIFFSQFD